MYVYNVETYIHSWSQARWADPADAVAARYMQYLYLYIYTYTYIYACISYLYISVYIYVCIYIM